jgi:hypothetical protein
MYVSRNSVKEKSWPDIVSVLTMVTPPGVVPLLGGVVVRRAMFLY